MKYLLRRVALLPLQPVPWSAAVKMLRSVRLLPAKTKASSHPPKRVLVVNFTDFVGDTVMMMPLLDRLHEAIPDAKIDVVTSPAMASFVSRIPYLDKVYGARIPSSRIPIWRFYVRLFELLRFAHKTLQSESYDLCLIPRWGIDLNMSVYLGTMTSAPDLAGHDSDEEAAAQNPFRGSRRFLTCVSRGGAGLPEAVRELRLLQACGIVETIDAEAEKTKPIGALMCMAADGGLADLRMRLKIGDAPYMVLAPGASHPSRCWPPERFAAVGAEIQRRHGMQILIVGGPAESSIGSAIEREASGAARSLTGQTSLSETVTLVSGAALLLANDSGPAHIGAGLGVPTVVLNAYPSNSTGFVVNFLKRVHPVGPSVRVLQPENNSVGCADRCIAPTAHCILGLGIETVLDEIEELLVASGLYPGPQVHNEMKSLLPS